MAGFGFGSFAKPQATNVRAGDVPKFGDLSMQEKLMMLGATLRGDQQTAMSIPMMAAARAKQAAEQEWRAGLNLEGVPMQRQVGVGNEEGSDISAAFSPATETVKGPRPTMRDLIPQLKAGMDRGYNVTPYMELLKAVDPDVEYVNGFRVDKRDPNGPSFIPTLEKGQGPDGRGGVGNLPGFVQSVTDLEGAKTNATERAKAAYDVIEIPMSDGSTVKLPRLEALQRLSGGGGSGVPVGVPNLSGGAPAGAGAGLGRSQTPADRVRAEGRAKTDVEIEALTPKAKSSLETMNRKSDFVLGVLDELLGERADPKTGKTVKVGDPMVRGGLGGTAGLNEVTKVIPGTASRNLDAKLDTLRATLGFAELQSMRDNSPTGGAVGNLTERELTLLSSLIGSLDQGQDPEQLLGILRKQRDELRKVSAERRSAFDRQYGEGRKPAGATGGGYSAADKARAAEILRQRRAARGQ